MRRLARLSQMGKLKGDTKREIIFGTRKPVTYWQVTVEEGKAASQSDLVCDDEFNWRLFTQIGKPLWIPQFDCICLQTS